MNVKEIFSDALPIIQKFAPSVGSAFGGPLGLAAGYIIPILANAFDSKPGNFKQLVSNIVNDPNAPAKLQDVEAEHGDWLETLQESVGNLAEAEINIKLKWQTIPIAA